MIDGAVRTDLIFVAEMVMVLVITTGVAQNAIYLFQLVVAAFELRRRPPILDARRLWSRYAGVAPRIAIIAPAFNEEATIIASTHAMLAQKYPDFDVIIVNDGSTDTTLERLIADFELHPVDEPIDLTLDHEPIRRVYRSSVVQRLMVIDKENGGKGDAQNAALNLCRAPLCCVMDGDTLLEPDALLRVVRPFVDDPERVVAVGATIRIANGTRIVDGQVEEVGVPKSFIARVQIIEYLRSFLMARLAWSRIGAIVLISGAFGVFRRDTLVAVGGYARGSMGEDLDVVIRLHRHLRREKQEYHIPFVPDPVCWTEVPEKLSVLARQRSRWQNGALECFFRHRGMALNPRYGRVGIAGFGQMLIVDVLGPIVEVLGYLTLPFFWYIGALNTESLLILTALVFGLGTFNSVASLILAELELRPYPRARDVLILGTAAILENFGYRQLHNLWRLRGYWHFLRSKKHWGEMPRAGFGQEESLVTSRNRQRSNA